jgi:hypothetical protein
VDPFDQVRSASELLAERAMERMLDLVVQAVDVNDLVQQVDVDALLTRVDLDALLSRVDLDALLTRVDLNRLLTRVDIDAIVQHTDIGAVVLLSSGSVADKAVDLVRGQGVALDRLIDRWVRRLLRRPGPGLRAPAPLSTGAGT